MNHLRLKEQGMDPMSTYQLTPLDECHSCNQPGYDLVKPCDNEGCTVRLHEACLALQVQENNMKCKGCDNPIIVTKTTEINRAGCCSSIKDWLIYFLLLLATPGTMIPMAFGFWINMPDAKKNEGLLVITSILTPFFRLLSWLWQ